MKKPFNPVIPDYRPKKKVAEEQKVDLLPCLICNREIADGYYARCGDRGVCSKTCMLEQDKKPKYGEHTEEAFLLRQAEQEKH